MRKIIRSTAILGIIVSFSLVASAAADPARSHPQSGLEGRVFAVEAEILFSLDPSTPVGLTFNNCYIFNEGGIWVDPLFPDPENGIVIPGAWIQHTELPKIIYTTTVDIDPGLLLVQNGTVNPSRGRGNQKLTAYTTVFFGGIPVIEVLSKGRAVETCPYFDVSEWTGS